MKWKSFGMIFHSQLNGESFKSVLSPVLSHHMTFPRYGVFLNHCRFFWLVGGIPTPLKNMKVNWDHYSHILWKEKIIFQTTNQIMMTWMIWVHLRLWWSHTLKVERLTISDLRPLFVVFVEPPIL
jgi:hypothetical protein